MSDSSIQTYNQIADKYIQITNTYIPTQTINDFLSHIKTKNPKILDLGCANGPHTNIFYKKGCEVIGVDPSEKLLEHARTDFPEIEFRQGKMQDLPFEGESFDGIWINAVFHHQEKSEMESTLQKLYDSLERGGILYISTKIGEDIQRKEIEGKGEISYTLIEMKELENMLHDTNFHIIDFKKTKDLLGRKTHWMNVFARR